jgi:hypothetical protein
LTVGICASCEANNGGASAPPLFYQAIHLQQSTMSDSLRIMSFRDGDPISEQVVAIAHNVRSMEIRELRNILHQPDSLATCIFELQPRNYLYVDMQLRRDDQRSRIMVRVSEIERSVVVEHNGHVTQQFDCNNDLILLDGPSPMFDWANAIMLLGICDGESFTVPVHVIDVQSGQLSPATYTFHRNDQRIRVQKGIDSLADSEIVLSPDSFEINVYYSGGYRYQNIEEEWQ